MELFQKTFDRLRQKKAEEISKKNYLELYKVHKLSETVFNEIKKHILRSFPIGSTVTELGTGKEYLVESFDIDNLLLKVVEAETGLRKVFDYKNSLEWNTFYFSQEAK